MLPISDWQKCRQLLGDFVCDWFGIGALVRFFKKEWPAMKLHRAVIIVTAVVFFAVGLLAGRLPDRAERQQANHAAHRRQILDKLSAFLLAGELLQRLVELHKLEGSRDQIAKWMNDMTVFFLQEQDLGAQYMVRVGSDHGIVQTRQLMRVRSESLSSVFERSA